MRGSVQLKPGETVGCVPFHYDDRGRRACVQDQSGNKTTYRYGRNLVACGVARIGWANPDPKKPTCSVLTRLGSRLFSLELTFSAHDPSPGLVRLLRICRCLAASRKPVSSYRFGLNKV